VGCGETTKGWALCSTLSTPLTIQRWPWTVSIAFWILHPAHDLLVRRLRSPKARPEMATTMISRGPREKVVL